MRALLPVMDVSFWTTISVVVFMAYFIGLTLWAYQSKRRSAFEQAERLPLEDDRTE